MWRIMAKSLIRQAGLSLEEAPRVGLEPTTNRLHLPPRFREEWTISSPAPGGGRVWGAQGWLIGSAPHHLVSAPSRLLPRRSSSLAQDCRHPKCCGFPE